MTYGSTLKEALNHRGLKQQELALETHYSEQTVSGWTKDVRNIQLESMPVVSNLLDDPFLTMETWAQATDGVAIPVLDGDYIMRNPASMKELVQMETNEAMEKLAEVRMIKPIIMQTQQEKEDMQKVIRELLDAACSIINMVAVLCREYDFSLKDLIKSWRVTLKARRYCK